jgi:hypothetical protein
MRWIKVDVGPGAGSTIRLAGEVAECPDCGRRSWYAFRLPPSKRILVQCAWCDRIECPDGRPAPELAAYALSAEAEGGVIHPLEQPGQEQS